MTQGATQTEDRPDRFAGWGPPDGFALGFLLLVCLVLFGGYFLDGATRVPGIPLGDARTQWICWRDFGFRWMARGVVPYWNPHVLCGTPFLANWQSALFYPPNALFMALPLHQAARAILFGHFFLGAAGAYALARYLGIGRYGAAAAGLVFALSAPQLLRLYAGHWGAACALAWMPFVLLGIEALVRRPTPGRAMLGGLPVAMQLLAGAPQYAAYTWILAGVYLVGRLVAPRGREAGRRPGAALRRLTFAVALFAFGVMLAAPQVVPALAAAPFGARAGGVRGTWAMAFSFQPDNMITFLAPGFFGNDAATRYWGFFNFWEMCAYLGVVTLAAAAAGVALDRRRLRWVLSACALVMLLLAFGKHIPPLYALYAALPGMAMLRGTSKFLSPFSLMMALLAGMGVEALRRAGPGAKRRAAIGCIAAATALATAAVVLDAHPGLWGRLVRSVLVRGEHTGLLTDEWDIAIAGMNAWLALMRAAGLLAFTGAVLGLAWLSVRRTERTDAARKPRRRAARRLGPVLVGLLLLDLATFGAVYLRPRHGVRADRARLDGEVVSFVERTFPHERGWVRGHRGLNDAMLAGLYTIEGIEPNPPLFFHQLFALGVRKPPDIAPSIYQITRPSPVWNLMGMRYIAVPRAQRGSVQGFPLAAELGEWLVYRNPHALPRAFLVHRSAAAPFDLRQAEGFPYREAVWLWRESAGAAPGGQGRAASDAARVVAESPNRLEIEADLASKGWLVLTDNYFPGWRAEANGRPVTIERADYAFRAVPLGAGRHRVVFTYRPDGLGTGVVLFLIAAAGSLVQCAAWAVRRRRRAGRVEGASARRSSGRRA